jgi:NAD+ kinase
MSTAPLRAVGLVPHCDRELAHELAARSARWLGDRGIEVRVPASDADAAGLAELAVADDTFAEGLDIAISLGGDGTMLRTVDKVYESGVAVFGVNVGQMGYLAEVEPADLDGVLVRLAEGDFEVVERLMLEVKVASDGPAAGCWWALNEAVLEKSRTGRLTRLAVAINGIPFTTYAADGVIVATPTGSTAYSFSARGPIVSPRVRCLLLTPVSPHMLFDRTLVLDPTTTLRLEVAGSRAANLSVDGRTLATLDEGDAITCTAAPRGARLVMFGQRDFLKILKSKFGLSDR